MKIRGKKIEGRNSVVVPILRPSGNIVFIVEAIENYDNFNKLVPQPEPPEVLRPGGIKDKDTSHPEYKKRLIDYAQMKSDYLIIASISATPDLTWEKVSLDDPRTWHSYRAELIESGLTEIEVGRLVNAVIRANSLDEVMIEEARRDFLATAAKLPT